MHCFGIHLTIGDVVLRGGEELGIITACASEGPSFFAIVDVLRIVGDVAPRASKCERTEISQAWPTQDLEQTICWYEEGSDLVVITR